MRTPLIRGSAGVIAAMLAFLLLLPMAVASAATAKNVKNGQEAWFMAKKELLKEPTGEDPSCELPTECNASGTAQRQNTHPEGTLAVAAVNGEPDAQTFFSFDLPFGAIVKDGKVTLPVAQDPEAESSNQRPEAAKMRACLVTGFITSDDAGAWGDKPAVNDKVCAPVKQEKADPLTFSFSLERLGKTWTQSTSGVTIMVDPDQVSSPNPAETWRVLFNSRRRSEQKTQDAKEQGTQDAVSYPAITSTIEYTMASNSGFGGGVVISTPPSGDFGGGGEDFSTSGGTSGGGDFATGGGSSAGDFGAAPPADDGGVIEPPASAGEPAVQEPVAADQGAGQPVAAGPAVPANAVGMSPAVWIAPLLALALAGAFAWSLTQPVELAGQREGAVSKLMRARRLSAAETSTP